MIIKTDIEEFLRLAAQHPVLDVRSPGEYNHAHIPGAYNLPLFSDQERKVVGTAYKQQDRQTAIKIGLEYFGVKMRKMVEEAEAIIKDSKLQIPDPRSLSQNSKFQIPNSDPTFVTNAGQLPTVSPAVVPGEPEQRRAHCLLVHCWRGGMRSAGVAWLLDLYGFKVYTLAGGYKAFRTWALAGFSKPLSFSVIGGYTGSGKTNVLYELKKAGQPTIDLEGIANHKGSAFGALGKEGQPTQEMFENLLALALNAVLSVAGNQPVWIEDESRRIGAVNLPETLWDTMRSSPVFFLDVPLEERLNFIVLEYGKFKKEELVASIMRISKRLGGLAVKQSINYLLEDNYKDCFRILLAYYDKHYKKGLSERKNLADLMTTVHADTVDATPNSNKFMALSRSQK